MPKRKEDYFTIVSFNKDTLRSEMSDETEELDIIDNLTVKEMQDLSETISDNIDMEQIQDIISDISRRLIRRKIEEKQTKQ